MIKEAVGKLANLAKAAHTRLFITDNPDGTFEEAEVDYVLDRDNNILFVEQNPDTGSVYADIANDGHDVMWTVDYDTNDYLGLSIDGQFMMLM